MKQELYCRVYWQSIRCGVETNSGFISFPEFCRTFSKWFYDPETARYYPDKDEKDFYYTVSLAAFID